MDGPQSGCNTMLALYQESLSTTDRRGAPALRPIRDSLRHWEEGSPLLGWPRPAPQAPRILARLTRTQWKWRADSSVLSSLHALLSPYP